VVNPAVKVTWESPAPQFCGIDNSLRSIRCIGRTAKGDAFVSGVVRIDVLVLIEGCQAHADGSSGTARCRRSQSEGIQGGRSNVEIQRSARPLDGSVATRVKF